MSYKNSAIDEKKQSVSENSRSDRPETDTVKVPVSGVEEHLRLLNTQLREALKEVGELIEKDILIQTPGQLEEFEKETADKTDRLAGLILGLGLQKSLNSPEMREDSAALIKSFPKKMKNQGIRKVVINPLRGIPVTVKTEYFSPKAKKDRRKRKRRGCYPGLVLSGIYDRCTPGLSSDIALTATALSSFEEARYILNERGRDLDIKTIRNVTIRYSERSRSAGLIQSDEFAENVAGCSVVISTDGGRIRIRERKSGRKTEKGRNRYKAAWREPKILIIYTAGEDGRMEKSFAPIIDGTLKGPDAVFSLIGYYLEKIGITKADRVLFIADGARWIWNRVEKLMMSAGVGKWYELIDFYHAVGHLNKIAGLQKWKKNLRKRWVTKYRRLLLKGKSVEVIGEIRRVCRGGKSRKLRTEKDYFIRNRSRLFYDKVAVAGLPAGSGSVESAVRRVVNLRLKGASTYWLRETAEAMLMLRSYFKAGRWNMLKKLSFSVNISNAA